MSDKHTRQSGLSIVELVTVMGIIALLSVVAIPQYKKFTARSRMAEAKQALKAIHTLQLTFFGEFSRYGVVAPIGKLASGTMACGINEIEFAFPGCTEPNSKIRYRYEVTNPGGPATFRAVASGKVVEGCLTEDVWEMRENGTLRHTMDASLLCR